MFDCKARGEALIATLETELAAARALANAMQRPPRVLFVMGTEGGVMAAGHGTAAHAVITLAGGHNVTQHRGYRPLSPEAVAALAPEVVVTVEHVAQAAGGAKRLLSRGGLSLTPAGRAGRVVVMDALLLLGFGPRLGQAVAALAGELGATTTGGGRP